LRSAKQAGAGLNVEFTPVRLVPAYRKVADAIIERILDRTLPHGERLPPEAALAEKFGVNRGTLREALRDLESQGLLTRQRGSKRMVVTQPRAAQLADGLQRAFAIQGITALEVWEALRVLEPPLAEAAALARTDEDIVALEAVVALYAADHTEAGHAVEHVGAFFRAVANASRNRVLALAQEPLVRLLEPTLALVIDRVPQARKRIADAEQQVAQAIIAGDAPRALNWMGKHIRDLRRGYEVAGITLDTMVSTAG
jgi:DNA-binding FadR family transcriptional regulator